MTLKLTNSWQLRCPAQSKSSRKFSLDEGRYQEPPLLTGDLQRGGVSFLYGPWLVDHAPANNSVPVSVCTAQIGLRGANRKKQTNKKTSFCNRPLLLLITRIRFLRHRKRVTTHNGKNHCLFVQLKKMHIHTQLFLFTPKGRLQGAIAIVY